jgi:hypothetical protein
MVVIRACWPEQLGEEPLLAIAQGDRSNARTSRPLDNRDGTPGAREEMTGGRDLGAVHVTAAFRVRASDSLPSCFIRYEIAGAIDGGLRKSRGQAHGSSPTGSGARSSRRRE